MAEPGQPSISPERAQLVRDAWPALILAVAEGENIGDACAAAKLSRHEVRHYRLKYPAADLEWQRAREQSADAYADKVAEMACNPPLDAARARVQLDALRWLAAKRNPRAYSDKSTLDVNVRTVDLTRIIEAAQARLAAQRAPRILDMAPELERLPAPADLAELL